MAKDLKQLIVDESEKLFIVQGYQDTSMRLIAKNSGISIGNLYYYFRKKEELIMVLHNALMENYIAQIPAKLADAAPWSAYIAAEYGFLHQIAREDATRHLYMEVINVPALREEYYKIHHDIFLMFLPESSFSMDSRDIYLSTVLLAAAEYHLIEQYDSLKAAISFEHIISYAFEAKMNALGVPSETRQAFISEGISLGQNLMGKVTLV